MAGQSIFVDPLSLDDFGSDLQARLDEAVAARLTLATPPVAALPPLGGFDDAATTAARLDTLRREYVARLDRLISALAAARAATLAVAQRYRTADALAAADPAAIRAAVLPVQNALDAGTASRA